MKTGTDLDESLYDPNEVVLNAKKFDSIFNKMKFSSTDNIDEIGELSLEEKEANASHDKKEEDKEEKKSYTNTINSNEFREFLRNKGLVLFPTKAKEKNDATKVNSSSKIATFNGRNSINRRSQPSDIANTPTNDLVLNDKKKTVFSRLSGIFSKNKTSPKSNVEKAKLSFNDKKDEANGSAIKRVVLERSKYQGENDNGPILANNEFLTSHNFLGRNSVDKSSRGSNDSDDKKSSISSVLTAAADDESFVDTPNLVRKNNTDSSTLYRNIDFTRSKLYKQQNAYPQTKAQPSADILKPRVYRPLNLIQTMNNAQVKAPTTLQRSNDYEFVPLEKFYKQQASVGDSSTPIRDDRYKLNLQRAPLAVDESYSDQVTFASNPNVRRSLRESDKNVPNQGVIDPFTFAKIHEIKRKTDEVLQNKSRPDERRNNAELNNSNNSFIRNSKFRSSDSYGQHSNYSRSNNLLPKTSLPQPPRSQSVLDNMTCYKNSLYGEVTYRQPNGNDVNVIMRRPDSSTLDRKQIMQKIYDYYRKSVNNTPVSLQEKPNLYIKSQSTNTPSLYASPRSTAPNVPQKPQNGLSYLQSYSDGSMKRGSYQMKPREVYSGASRSSTMDSRLRKPTISESDSEYPPDSICSMDNYPRYVAAGREQLTPVNTPNYANPLYDQPRIYDTVSRSPREALYGHVNRQRNEGGFELRRPSSSAGYALPLTTKPIQREIPPNYGRMTPVILQSTSRPQHLPHQMDIIYNNQIYRPISAIPQSNLLPQPVDNRMKKILTTPESDGSETGEVQRIMQSRYGE